MPVKLKIKVTKAVLNESKNCGILNGGKPMATNCAIAVAVRDIFPNAIVTKSSIGLFGFDREIIENDQKTMDFITKFDSSFPEQRPSLPEFEFEMSIPDSVIEEIDIEELKPLLENHPTLHLIEEEI
jgi:hypothetical protein